ncbi:MAG: ribbon-helix-helix domain-containing protein [Nitrospirota bacterium]
MLKARTTRGRVAVTVSLPPAMLKAAQARARKERRSKSEVLREAFRQYEERARTLEALYAYGEQQAKELGITSEADVERIVSEYRREQAAKSV